MNKRYLYFTIFILTICIAVTSITLLTTRKPEGDMPPIPKLSAHGQDIPVVLGSYSWQGNYDREVNFDELIKQSLPVIPLNDLNIKIDFDGYRPKPNDMSYGIIKKNGENWIGLAVAYGIKNNVLEAKRELSNGIVIIKLTARWKSGESVDYFIPLKLE